MSFGVNVRTTISRTSRTLLLLSCVACGLSIWVVRSVPRPLVAPLAFTVSNATNTPQGQLQSFAVTNVSQRGITLLPCVPITRQGRVWSGRIEAWPNYIRLRAQGCTTFSVRAATNGEAWRVPVRWFETPTSSAWFTQALRHGFGLKAIIRGTSPKLLPLGDDLDQGMQFTPEVSR